MLSVKLLKELLEIWESFGYDCFKCEIKEKKLSKKGFGVREIRKAIVEDRELMEDYYLESPYDLRLRKGIRR